jgi:hypothetical protein
MEFNMSPLLRAMLATSSLLLTACGGGDLPETHLVATERLASVLIVSTAELASRRAPVLESMPASTSSPLDGKWACLSEDGRATALRLQVSGNLLRDLASDVTMTLSHGKGIELGTRLVDYRDAESGQIAHAREMSQVSKPGYASFFARESYGGAGAGVEFSINPNDTLKISDFSSLNGSGTIAQAIPMTCRRDTMTA